MLFRCALAFDELAMTRSVLERCKPCRPLRLTPTSPLAPRGGECRRPDQSADQEGANPVAALLVAVHGVESKLAAVFRYRLR